MAQRVVIARQMFPAEEEDGQTVVVPQGARFAATDPIVKANPEQFKPARALRSPRDKGKGGGS